MAASTLEELLTAIDTEQLATVGNRIRRRIRRARSVNNLARCERCEQLLDYVVEELASRQMAMLGEEWSDPKPS